MISARRDFRSPLHQTRLLVPETLLPVQIYDSMRRPLTPEKRLVIAVLADALDCLQRRRGGRARSEAERWLMSEDRQWPFSFENICDVLSIDSDRVRGTLHSWRAQQETSNAAAAPQETGMAPKTRGSWTST